LHIDRYTKELIKSYCRTLLAEHGLLTEELFNKINSGDEETMRQVCISQQDRIRDQAQTISDPIIKEITLSQINSIQEVLDALPEILSA